MPNWEIVECPVCCWTEAGAVYAGTGNDYLIECPVCGQFISSNSPGWTRVGELSSKEKRDRALLSHRIRKENEAGNKRAVVSHELIDEIVRSGSSLPLPSEQAISIIRYVGERVLASGVPLERFDWDFHASIGAVSRLFALDIVKELFGRGILTGHPRAVGVSGPTEIGLSLAGWEAFEAQRRGTLSGRYGFIALEFDDEILDPFLKDVIKPAVSQIGYDLRDARDIARSGLIDNIMREQIRDAAFVLVDLSHGNKGAYWEAGYAEGLGKPVLYICEAKVFDDVGTHFDTNHSTTVKWSPDKPDEFSADLVATLRRSLGLFER